MTAQQKAAIRKLDLPDWRPLYPEAVAEPPSEPLGDWVRTDSMPDGAEYWECAKYSVTVRRKEDTVFGTRNGMIQLGISSADGTARHDWRDFQAIKNRFAGEEAEAFELYPAESRLQDPSNYYMLWCFPKTRIRVGTVTPRNVETPDEAVAPQRGWL